jgi:uncharacterized membrane protein
MVNELQEAKEMETFSIKEALSYGWTTFKKRPWFFIAFTVIIIVLNLAPGFLSGPRDNNPHDLNAYKFIITVLGAILSWIVSLGTINFALNIYDNKPAAYSDIFAKWRLAFQFFLASILYGLIVIAGFILLIIPGIIWSIKFRYYPYLMVDRKTGVLESLRLSSRITDGNKWRIFLFNIVTMLIVLLGFILLGVGILAAIPVTMLASAYVYRKLSSEK